MLARGRLPAAGSGMTPAGFFNLFNVCYTGRRASLACNSFGYPKKGTAVHTGNHTRNKMIEFLIRLALLGGIFYFGFIFPDSLSNHEKLLHFAAHVGMSFFVASVMYVICNITFRFTKGRSILILLVVTLIVGAIYKYWEIAGQGLLHTYSLGELLVITGFYTSMSQNMAGILASILLIEYAASYLKWQVLARG